TRLLAKVGGTLQSDAERSAYRDLRSDFAAWGPVRDRVLSLSEAGQNDAAFRLSKTQGKETFAKVRNGFTELFDAKVAQSAREAEQATQVHESRRLVLIVVTLLALLAAVVFAVVIVLSVKRPLAVVIERLNTLKDHCITDLGKGVAAMAGGDLRV